MGECEYKDDVIKLLNALVNILAIVKHFQNKIKEWLAEQGLSTPTEEQILDVVRKNYDLTLKLQDSLDQYERYAETPLHTNFFKLMVRDVVNDTRKHIYGYVKEAVSVIRGVYCFPLDEEVPNGIVFAVHWCYPSDLVLPEEMPSEAKLSVEGTLVGADWPSAVPGQPGTDAGQEVQHIPFVAAGSEHI